jgi:pimeloyl-ACP methyl ester carboxylesterase/tellurite resistance protein
MDAGLTPTAIFPTQWANEALAYGVDRWQRSVLFWDVLRQRGNNYLAHLYAGQPPVLIFDYDTILNGRDFDPPVNYALVKIRERRHGDHDRRRRPRDNGSRRQVLPANGRRQGDESARPLVVIDPRAGHGPGIGGSKIESQIGVALEYGYPVYFITFFPDPVPGQSVADVQQAEIRFLEEVARRHTGAPKPAVIGNCQAGWAAALIGADRPDVVGPMVFNGSPLSYWGGVEGANPMRYKGGLVGGIWPTSFWSDIGNGEFDGAHLVAGFEDLNPANTYWQKLYHLFSRVDTEAKRFLNFEKWWGGFFKLSAEEIHFITRGLFVGNELEKGMLELTKDHPIHLKNFKDPIFIFASSGDNITPPPQALNWIVKVYGSVREIKRQGQVIVYMVHEEIGHLGIFVSGKVAAKEHREIISCLDMLEFLVPGLYEMVITENATNPDVGDYCVRFEARDTADILTLDDGLKEEEAFESVAALSQANDAAYRIWVRPWVRLLANPWLAEASRQMHPLRMQRYFWSDLNPWSWPVALGADQVRAQRKPVKTANSFAALETFMSQMTVAALDAYRDTRDLAQEWLFKTLYDHAWMKPWWSEAPDPAQSSADWATRRRERAHARRLADQGGFAEAVVRITIAVTGVDRILDKRELTRARTIYQRHPRYQQLELAELRQMVNTQAHILAVDHQRALDGLAVMLPGRRERKEAFKIAEEIAVADKGVSADERQVLAAIRSRLNLDQG